MLAKPIAAETGWPLTLVVGGVSVGLLAAGLVSPRVGRTIGRDGGRPVLAASSVLLAIGLMSLGLARSPVTYVAAWLVLGLGAVGVVVPILPTTPLVLLASALFAKSSPRFDAWLRTTRLYKSYVVPFRETGGRPKLTGSGYCHLSLFKRSPWATMGRISCRTF